MSAVEDRMISDLISLGVKVNGSFLDAEPKDSHGKPEES